MATALLLALSSRVRAQSSAEPQLVFTIYVGLSQGTSLWRIPAQPLLVTGGSLQDTVSLARQMRPGLVAGLGGTYYVSPHLGWTGEISYFGIGSEQRCDGPAGGFKTDPQNENSQACTSAQGQHVGTNVVGLLGGFTYRFAPEARVQPFVRLTAGLGLVGNSSYIETTGFAVLTNPSGCSVGCTVTLLRETDTRQATWVVNMAAGISVSVAPAYRLRFEARDIVTSLTAAMGPRDPLDNSSEPPKGSVVKHLPTFLFGLEIVLERRHSRRY